MLVDMRKFYEKLVLFLKLLVTGEKCLWSGDSGESSLRFEV
jgi:hypothetical protein